MSVPVGYAGLGSSQTTTATCLHLLVPLDCSTSVEVVGTDPFMNEILFAALRHTILVLGMDFQDWSTMATGANHQTWPPPQSQLVLALESNSQIVQLTAS